MNYICWMSNVEGIDFHFGISISLFFPRQFFISCFQPCSPVATVTTPTLVKRGCWSTRRLFMREPWQDVTSVRQLSNINLTWTSTSWQCIQLNPFLVTNALGSPDLGFYTTDTCEKDTMKELINVNFVTSEQQLRATSRDTHITDLSSSINARNVGRNFCTLIC